MKKNYSIFALVFYFILALLFLGLPNRFDFMNRLHISGDPAFYLWSLKWWPYALSHGLNPFLTKAFWAPYGQNLAWTTSCPSIAIMMWPITNSLGEIFSYNLITILSLTIGSYGIYLINKQIGLSETSSIFGGLIFFFSSYVWGQLLGHLNLYTVFIVVFLVYLYVLRLKSLIGKKLYTILYGLLLAYQFGISNEIYATFIVFSFIGLVILFVLYFKQTDDRKKILDLGVESLIGICLSMIVLTPYIYYIFYGSISEPLNSNAVYVADPINFFIPTPVSWIFGKQSLSISSKFAGNFSETGAYLGLPLIFILISFSYMVIRKIKENKLFLFLLIFLIISIVLSFGPYLRILNHQTIPMPWIIFTKMPLIKHALPTRFTLYVDLIVAIIAAIWFERFNKQCLKYIIAILAVLFLIPNVSVYSGRRVDKFIPTFIKTGEYKDYISKGENIIIFPSYALGGFQPMLWQQKTNFYFNLSQEIAGPLPKELSKDANIQSVLTNFFYGETTPLLTNDSQFSFFSYIAKCNISAIILPDNYDNPIVNKLMELLNIKPLYTGGVKLYKVNNSFIKTSLSNLKNKHKEYLLHIYETLFNSSIQFIESGNNPSNLLPQYLESNGYLEKSFGYQTGPANNWTQNGGWIGKWVCPDGEGKCFFGVGLVGDIDMLTPIIDKYKSQAVQIFFPYPKVYKENTEDKSGQLLMIFKAPKSEPDISSFPFTMDFKASGNGSVFQGNGFCSPENWGTWSCAKEISLKFNLPKSYLGDAYLNLEFNTLSTKNHAQTAEFYLNDHFLDKKQFATSGPHNISFDISKYLKQKNMLIIKVPDAATPKSLGINADTRELGIGLIKIDLTSKK